MKKKREKRRYFTQETEDAIVRYNSTFDVVEKNKIYGCGKPFQIMSLLGDNDQVEWIVIKCEYI
jgi:hypothetical protein